MPEYHDRFIRDEKHFEAVCEYIRNNPVKAGLVEAAEKWEWGSAFAAHECGRDARVPRGTRAPGT
jgi:hypothetical protein